MSSEQISSRPLSVTMVCGFVGAGKSTVIRELLAERGTEQWAVLVHDRSEHDWAAVDGAGQAINIYSLGESLAELTRSCVSCSFREALTDAISSIAEMRRFDRLIVECSGLVEATMAAAVFNDAIADEEPLAGLARLEQLVTVVDAATVWEGIRSADALRERGMSGGEDDTRVLSELLVEQIEHCSLIALNRSAGIDVDCRERVITLLRYLNPEAEVLLAADRVKREERILARRDGAEYGISFQPGWAKLIDQADVPPEPSQAWSTGVFRASRPFHPERLWRCIEEDWPGVLRCKGYFWLASEPDRCFSWEQTAGSRHFEWVGQWWVATPQPEWPTNEAFLRRLKSQWTIEFWRSTSGTGVYRVWSRSGGTVRPPEGLSADCGGTLAW
ncbi:MAG: putative metal chaperone YciC [Nitrospira sp. OLB3]|nr:MAG: putative metal chaperone YciC [Nitrospira sp. OLB3]